MKKVTSSFDSQTLPSLNQLNNSIDTFKPTMAIDFTYHQQPPAALLAQADRMADIDNGPTNSTQPPSAASGSSYQTAHTFSNLPRRSIPRSRSSTSPSKLVTSRPSSKHRKAANVVIRHAYPIDPSKKSAMDSKTSSSTQLPVPGPHDRPFSIPSKSIASSATGSSRLLAARSISSSSLPVPLAVPPSFSRAVSLVTPTPEEDSHNHPEPVPNPSADSYTEKPHSSIANPSIPTLPSTPIQTPVNGLHVNTNLPAGDSDYPSIDSSDPPTLLSQLRNSNATDPPLMNPGLQHNLHNSAQSVYQSKEDGIVDSVSANPTDIAAEVLRGTESMTLGEFFSRALALGRQRNTWLLPEPQINDLLEQGAANDALNTMMSADELLVALSKIVPPQSSFAQPETPPPLPPLKPVTPSAVLGISATFLRPSPPALSTFSRTSPLSRNAVTGQQSPLPSKSELEMLSSPLLDTQSYMSPITSRSGIAASVAGSSPSHWIEDRSGANSPSDMNNLNGHLGTAPRLASLHTINHHPTAQLFAPIDAGGTLNRSVRLSELEKEIDKLNDHLGDRDVQIRNLKGTADRLRSQLSSVHETLKEAEARSSEHARELDCLRTELATTSNSATAHLNSLNTARSDLDLRERTVAQLEADLVKARDANAQMRTLLARSNEREREVSLELANVQKSLASAVFRIQELEEKVQVYRVDVENGEQTMNAALAEAQDALELAQGEVRAKANRVRQLEATVNQLLNDQLNGASDGSQVSRGLSGEPSTESMESVDHEIPEPNLHAPTPSFQHESFAATADAPLTLAAEINHAAVGDDEVYLDHLGQVTQAQDEEVAVLQATTDILQADIGVTNLELINSENRIRELELNLDQVNERLSLVSETNARERQMWECERARLLDTIQSLGTIQSLDTVQSLEPRPAHVVASPPDDEQVPDPFFVVTRWLIPFHVVRAAVYILLVVGGLVSIGIACVQMILDKELRDMQRVPLVEKSGFALYPSYVRADGLLSLLFGKVWMAAQDDAAFFPA